MFPNAFRILAGIILGCALGVSAGRTGETPAPAPVPANAAPKTLADYRDGAWASYRIVTAANHLYFIPAAALENGGEKPLELTCRFTVRRPTEKQTKIEANIALQGANPLNSLMLDDFPLRKIITEDAEAAAASVANGHPAEYAIPATAHSPSRKIPAVRMLLNGAGMKIEVWKSPAVPFGIVKIVCGDFQLSLTGCGW